MKQFRFPTCMLLIGIVGELSAGNRFQSLLDNNPFIPAEAKVAPAPPAAPRLEFRGRSVESGVEYFSLYNRDTQKSFWLSREGNAEFRIQDYSPDRGLVLVDQSGKNLSLELKDFSPVPYQAQPSALASLPPGASTPTSPDVTAKSVANQLEMVAEQIRARRAQRPKSSIAKT